jgi:hypothetical protein
LLRTAIAEIAVRACRATYVRTFAISTVASIAMEYGT